MGGTCSSEGWCWHPGAGSLDVLVCEVVCTAVSLGFKVLGRHCGSIIRAVQVLQCGQSQALDEGSVVLAEDSSQCAAGQLILPKYFLLELLFLKTWHVLFMEQKGPLQLVILSPSAFLRAFPLTSGLHLQQLFLFLNRNTVDQTNLFISAYFFSCADSDIRFPLQFISGSHLDSVRCWVLLPVSETGSGSSVETT